VVIDTTRSVSVCADELVAFLRNHRPAVINVCGHRKSKGDDEKQEKAEAILRSALTRLYITANQTQS
jgi:hypothetical protein